MYFLILEFVCNNQIQPYANNRKKMYAKNTFWCQNSELTVNFKNMIAQS
jgi:hypothetical protein